MLRSQQRITGEIKILGFTISFGIAGVTIASFEPVHSMNQFDLVKMVRVDE